MGLLWRLAVNGHLGGLAVDGLLVDGLAVLIHGLTIDGLSTVLLHNDDPRIVVILLAVVPVMGLLESNHASSASGRSHDGADAAEDEQEGQSPPEPHELSEKLAKAITRKAITIDLFFIT